MAKASLDATQTKLDAQGLDPIAKRNRKDNTQLELIDGPTGDWFEGCDDHLKYANIRRQVYLDKRGPASIMNIAQLPKEYVVRNTFKQEHVAVAPY